MDTDESGNDRGRHRTDVGGSPLPSTNQRPSTTTGAFDVQPILISSQPSPTVSRAPPSLIPIATFSNQLKAQAQSGYDQAPSSGHYQPPPAFVSRQHTNIGLYEASDDVDDEDDSPDESGRQQRVGPEVGAFGSTHVTGHGTQPPATSSLVSTSSHSIASGVKLHIHRAPPTRQHVPSHEEANADAMDLSYSEENSNQNSNLSSILNAIRSNTSLTIEEVPPKPSSSSSVSTSQARFSSRMEAADEGSRSLLRPQTSDKVEVFIVPQGISPRSRVESPQPSVSVHTISPEVKTPAKRGRPRRQPLISTPPPHESPAPDSTSRRTGRDRKPTKHFMPDISKFRGYRKRGNESESSKIEAPASPIPDPKTPTTEDKTETHDEKAAETPSTPKRRGRQPTGRPRGRPRGSVMKPKIDRQSTIDTGADGTTSPTKTDGGTSNEEDAIQKGLRGGVSGRGGKVSRGGGRGGRRITKAQKIQMAKLKKLLSKRKDSLQLFEEETRMSSADGKVGTGTVTQMLEDEDANASNSTSTSTTTKSKKQWKAAEVEERKPVTSDTLFEYHWPVDDPFAEIFFLQEQVSDYLGVKSFKRKYPDLKRRTVEMAERDFLRSHKVVSETQCDLGLTALYSNEVLEIMFNDFPEKYEEYRVVVQERRDKEFIKQKSHQAAPAVKERDKGAEFMRRILNSASSWNSKLNRERIEDRSCIFDLQSYTLNVQRSKRKVLPSSATKMGYYPVAVLPGQYTDGYKKYSPDEMKYLPLNTVSFGPLIENQFESADSDDTSDSASSSSDDSSSSSDSDETGSEDKAEKARKKSTARAGTSFATTSGTTGLDTAICQTCEGDANKNKDGQAEALIKCTKCSLASHPSCLELTQDMLPYIKKYNWQCTNCKNCIECNDPANEDKMLFCDLCDRGYHIYCVGLRRVPTGRWHCRVCTPATGIAT